LRTVVVEAVRMLSGRARCLVLVIVTLSGASLRDHATAADRQPGMKAHVDPRSGVLVPAPVAPEPAEPLPAPVPSFREERAPGGGTMVRLNGQFMSNLVATVNPDGSVRIECQTGPAARKPH
jgi:hypothetical protein